ncbi:uncharacterized protein LOC124312634 isoform X1 [Daphnia pulicaria]|uniref:uncharacterized protein LOC124312634 isoform X1 n=1 Tax=Daphnia pulicaria TaxID=35523 RepID=UPI001EEBF984|nr:uncharacterized protein LOC124312634 isoform X1 [Daphnia pulicaria]
MILSRVCCPLPLRDEAQCSRASRAHRPRPSRPTSGREIQFGNSKESIIMGVGVIATTIATFLRSVDTSSGVIGGHHPSAHALSYILSPHSLHNGTIGGSGGQSLEYGGFTEENFEEIEAIESSVPPGQPPGNPAQTVIDIIAVFGAMFVAAVAIILITVYISKLRKRQSSALSTPDAEAASTSPSSDCSACPHSGDPGSPASIAQFNKEVQDAWSAIDFGQKPSLWRKTIRSMILRLRGQEQHKDVYVMPQHLRDQLKQMYVY